jgi:hypothetical protein
LAGQRQSLNDPDPPFALDESGPWSKIADSESAAYIPPTPSLVEGKRMAQGSWANSSAYTPAEFQEYTQPLRDIGWIDGKNLTIEQRYTGGDNTLLRLMCPCESRWTPAALPWVPVE